MLLGGNSVFPQKISGPFTVYCTGRIKQSLVYFQVKPIKLSKAGIPLGVFSLGGPRNTVKESDAMEAEETQTDVPRNTVRHKDESKEEKKQRKQEVKNDRKVSSSML